MTLAPWPEKQRPEPAYGISAQFMADANYYQALALAWESRCRLAVEALTIAADDLGSMDHPAHKALCQIGDLPIET